MSRANFFSGRRRLILLAAILIAISTGVTGITMSVLYDTAFEEQRARLIDTATSRARMIEAVARYDLHKHLFHQEYFLGEENTCNLIELATEATLSQIREAHSKFKGLGKTGEFTLAKLEDDQVVFLLNHRHTDLNELPPVAYDSKLAEPMKRALDGMSGTMVGLDYRGERVLAAYEPVAELDLGIVAKIDLAEIREPFINAGLAAAGSAIILILIGIILFFRIGNPIIKRLEKSEDRFRKLFRHSNDAIFIHDFEGRLLDVNERARQMLGYSREEMLSIPIIDLHPRSCLDQARRAVESMADNGSARFESKFIKSDATEIDVEISSRVVDPEKGLVQSIARDITDCKKAKRKLRASQNKFKKLFTSVNSGIGMVDENETIRMCNPAYMELFEAESADEIVGRKLFEFLPEQSHKTILEQTSLRKDNKTSNYDLEILTTKGNRRQIHVSVSPRFDSNNKYIGAFGSIIDITARKQAEKALRESEEKFRELAEMLPQTVFEVDLNYRLTYSNRHGFTITGYTEDDFRRGLNIFELIAPKDHDRLRANIEHTMAGKKQESNEYILLKKNGSECPVLAYTLQIVHDGKPAGLRGLIVDITERKKIEAELAKSDKLESIGILAGGIAHDFNNILTAVIGNVSLAAMETDSQSKIGKYLRDADKALTRTIDLTRQLLTFSKGGAPIKKTASIAEIISDCTQFALHGSNVKIELAIPDNLPNADIDFGQISQVLYNLIINANQAMPQGGVIRVEAGEISVRRSELPLNPGNYIRISVRDQGEGIAEENLSKIFDPFFTTKQKGNGLGLATSYAIIKSHDGHIECRSEVGTGSEFIIHLPASEKTMDQIVEIDDEKYTCDSRILIMDDDDMVLEVVRKSLTRLGYEVDSARDGSEATSIYKIAYNSDRPINMVILDLTIPGGMGGVETIAELKKIDSDVRAIVCSGYSNDPVMSNYRDYGFCGIVSKPFKPAKLAQAIRKIENAANQPIIIC